MVMSGSGKSSDGPATTPITAMVPPSFDARIDCLIVPAPPTSTTRSTPRPPLSLRAVFPHSASSR